MFARGVSAKCIANKRATNAFYFISCNTHTNTRTTN
ncbi:ribose 5-phosphate isomerase [Listeria monocytogenes]|nr:ribose 5-phosphate isomerase [Listeria monocytogenes]GAT39365.1 ribose 5-phosphate isomerase [Listeria monocytogenes]